MLTPERRAELLYFLRKVVVLRHSERCGVCGSGRYQVRPFWSLGMSVCRYCLQDNLVTDRVLYERYWFSFTHGFLRQTAGRIFYFQEMTTPGQRMDYTLDLENFSGGDATTSNFYFWRPHLDRLLDLKALEHEAPAKRQAAALIRAAARRAVTTAFMAKLRGHTLRDRRPISTKLLVREHKRRMHTKTQSFFQPPAYVMAVTGQDYITDARMRALAGDRPLP